MSNTGRCIHTVYNPADDGAAGYVISENEMWLPGSYASEEAARQAFELPDKLLYELQERINNVVSGEARLITLDDLTGGGDR